MLNLFLTLNVYFSKCSARIFSDSIMLNMFELICDALILLQNLNPNYPVMLPQKDEMKKVEITIKKKNPKKTVEIELSVKRCAKISKYISCSTQT